MVRVRQTVAKDAGQLASKLRAADLLEIKAVTHEDPYSLIRHSIVWSHPCYTIVEEKDQPLAIFGAVPDPCTKGLGRIWLLGSEELVLHHSYTLLRRSREWIDKLHESYSTLWNYVDARNTVHIRWLEWCGFTLLRRVEGHGVEQRLFYEFEKVAQVAPQKKWEA